jgi:hypothetical protein
VISFIVFSSFSLEAQTTEAFLAPDIHAQRKDAGWAAVEKTEMQLIAHERTRATSSAGSMKSQDVKEHLIVLMQIRRTSATKSEKDTNSLDRSSEWNQCGCAEDDGPNMLLRGKML